MNIITKKVRLIPAPFVGTKIKISVLDSLKFKIRVLVLAEGHDKIAIEWGDGSTQFLNKTSTSVEHDYPSTGDYIIKLSDDVKHICIGFPNGESEYHTIYAPMVRGFSSNATQLLLIPGFGFHNCVNLQCFDVAKSGVKSILSESFKNCASLSGELFFPKVNELNGDSSSMPFAGCTKITAIHFANANAAAITASTAYNADEGHTLGTGVKDVCKFDL